MARVLVIDDDEEHRTLLRAMLEGAGHQVQEAEDGVEGLRLFGQGRPDLVFTDINMPGLDGHDVISALRVQHADVPVVAISGGVDEGSRRAVVVEVIQRRGVGIRRKSKACA